MLSKTLVGLFAAAIIVIGVYPDAVRNLLVKAPAKVAQAE
jgi:hypothetical protein